MLLLLLLFWCNATAFSLQFQCKFTLFLLLIFIHFMLGLTVWHSALFCAFNKDLTVWNCFSANCLTGCIPFLYCNFKWEEESAHARTRYHAQCTSNYIAFDCILHSHCLKWFTRFAYVQNDCFIAFYSVFFFFSFSFVSPSFIVFTRWTHRRKNK